MSTTPTPTYDFDGMVDILWLETTGEVAIWLMNGTTVLSGTSIMNVSTEWTPAGNGDFNGDGKTDVLWRHTGGNVAMWLMDGITIVSNSFLSNVETSWTTK